MTPGLVTPAIHSVCYSLVVVVTMLVAASRRVAVSARSKSSLQLHKGTQLQLQRHGGRERRRVLVTRSSAGKKTPMQRFMTPVLVWSDDILEMCSEFLPEVSAKSVTRTALGGVSFVRRASSSSAPHTSSRRLTRHAGRSRLSSRASHYSMYRLTSAFQPSPNSFASISRRTS